MFKGMFPLVKFGKFAEVSDALSIESSSDPMEMEDDVITASEKEEEPVPPVAIVAEEHDQMENVKGQSDYNSEGDDDDDEGFDDDDDTIFGGDMSGFDNDTIYYFEKRNNDYCPSIEELHSFFDNVYEFAQPAKETGGVDEVQKATPLT